MAADMHEAARLRARQWYKLEVYKGKTPPRKDQELD
jgi:hypothetical protein